MHIRKNQVLVAGKDLQLNDLKRERVSEDFPLPVLPTIPTWWFLVGSTL